MAAQQISGAVFTTDAACAGVDLNIYDSKDAVYVNGGPEVSPGQSNNDNGNRPSAALPDGFYYVQVTEPNGDVLGTSLGAQNATPVSVVNVAFASCYQLSAILVRASDGTPGYDDTGNAGGEYKLWVSTSPAFEPQTSKTDNSKVRADETGVTVLPAPPSILEVVKFYDANANGINDDGQIIDGWKMTVSHADHTDSVRWTPVSMIVDPGTFVVAESGPVQTNWLPSTAPSVTAEVAAASTTTVSFGNVCVGAGGGSTLGYWSNKNSQPFVNSASRLGALSALNLRDETGANFDPTSYARYRSWLLGGSATNMAYMLSVQMTATQLSVWRGDYSGSAIIYAPGTSGANAFGFAAIGSLLAEANAELGSFGFTLSDSARRAYQEALKNAFDRANNNLNFVQASACAFSF